MVTDSSPIDNTVEIVTPENIAFRYQVAGPFRRMVAFLLDQIVQDVVLVAIVVPVVLPMRISGLFDFAFFLLAIAAFGMQWLYGGLFELYWNGQTPGKWVLGIRVLSVDGQPIDSFQAVVRNFLRFADLQPLPFCLVGVISAMMNSRYQRLGDLACGTMVVVEERHWFRGVLRINEPEAHRLADLIPAGFQTSNTLARALAAYVQRRPYFLWPRRQEIARHVGEPLRRQFGLPPETNLDQLLCGLYHRAFITDRAGEGTQRRGRRRRESLSPFVRFDLLRPPPGEPAPAAPDTPQPPANVPP